MADMLKFYKGLVASLPETGANGAIYITTDEGGIYLGTGTGIKRLGDFVQVADVKSLPAKAHETCLYYCVAENILAKWNGTEWKQVNKQPTTEELKTLLGLGSAAYTDADAYDAAGSAAAVRTYVGDIPNGDDGTPMADSVVAYINKKTDGIATSGNLEALGNRVTTAEGEIDALQEASATHAVKTEVEAELAKKVDKVEGKSLIADTEITRLSGMSDGANKVEKSETNGSIKVDGQEVVVYTHPDKHAIDDVTGLQDAIDDAKKAGTDASAALEAYKTSNDKALEDEVKARGEADSALDERITAIEGKFGEGDGTVESKIEAAVSAETKAREEAVKGVQDAVDAVEGRMDTAEGKITALETASATHAVKTEVEASLALKADKSVVDAMYTNDKIDELVQSAKDYADTNDTKYGIAYDSDSKKITLVEGGTASEIDATDFIKDGMIESVAIDEETQELVITWNTDAGKSATRIALSELADIYTGVDGTTVTVTVSSDDKIGAEVKTGSIKDGHIASDAAIAKGKLAADVQASLDKADSALQAHQDISHLATTEAMNTALGLKADKTQVATDIATAQSAAEAKAAELDAALKTELQAEIDADVKALADGAVATNAADIAALTQTHATDKTALEKAITDGDAAVEKKVTELAEGAVATNTSDIEDIMEMLTWGSF